MNEIIRTKYGQWLAQNRERQEHPRTFPSPSDLSAVNSRDNAKALGEAVAYANGVNTKIRSGTLREDSEGWLFVHDPSLPMSFQKGNAQWKHLLDEIGNDWEVDIFSGGRACDQEHTLKLRRRR